MKHARLFHKTKKGVAACLQQLLLILAERQYGLRSDSGEVAGVTFGFERHGIFLEYGVGRGHPAHGVHRSMSDWLSGTLQKKEQGVIDIVATYQSDKYIRTFMGFDGKKTAASVS